MSSAKMVAIFFQGETRQGQVNMTVLRFQVYFHFQYKTAS